MALMARPARDDKMVETMLTAADGLRLTAYGPGKDEVRIVAGGEDA
jgi:hypothetical protein